MVDGTSGMNGLVIVDITNPVSPTLIGLYDTPGGLTSTSVEISSDGNTAYIAETNTGLVIIDITNPAAPFEK